ncbi:hypothetical protein ACTFIY_009109 [Dictyostelium cf. discoideum]
MFKITANTVPGVLDWTLTFAKFNILINTALPDKYQLNIISENIDIVGPIVTKIVKKSQSDFGTPNVGWLLTIEDEINGLLDGYVTVIGSLDSSLYNFSISPSTAVRGSGDKWKADYLISIPLQDNLNNYGCIAQDYTVARVKLIDTFGNVNKYFSHVTQEDIEIQIAFLWQVSPFYRFEKDSLIISVDNKTCSTALDTSPPNLISSSKSFGDTTNGDDSNFIKLQIDDHSVYGRFLKRAIVDDLVVSVDNVLLDDSMNTIESNAHAQQSYIGIIIPHYSDSVSIDPDFSILIDQNAASESSENSICSKKSGLTKGQIAGITIGAVCFATVIVVSVVYSVHKTKKNKKMTDSIAKKLEAFNK